MDLRQKIKTKFWKELTRELTPQNALQCAKDTKVAPSDGKYRIYVPPGKAWPEEAATLQQQLPPVSGITPDYVYSLNKKPGILDLATENGKPLPYLVPGGRFNEFYGWDSYFIALGLLQDGYIELARAIALQFVYEIDNYGKILNANRSYYLNRSQPPFLTDLSLRVAKLTGDKAFLKKTMLAAVKEYETVWCANPRLDTTTGLSRYRPNGRGIPPEVEPGHFDFVLEPIAKERGLSVEQVAQKFDDGTLNSPELDNFFMNDRAVRESGHDTSTRLHDICGELATIDLNSLLYKYEVDIASVAEELGLDAQLWQSRAAERARRVTQYLWNENDGLFYDYNTETQKQHKVPSATVYWALWSGLATKEQAARIVSNLPLFEQDGGLACTPLLPDQPKKPRQWDYPHGWAPHQILAWQGLEQYGYADDAKRLATKWVHMVANTYKKTGKVVEKYNVCDLENAHAVAAEYGNQGNGNEGFGWTNASYAIGYARSPSAL